MMQGKREEDRDYSDRLFRECMNHMDREEYSFMLMISEETLEDEFGGGRQISMQV